MAKLALKSLLLAFVFTPIVVQPQEMPFPVPAAFVLIDAAWRLITRAPLEAGQIRTLAWALAIPVLVTGPAIGFFLRRRRAKP